MKVKTVEITFRRENGNQLLGFKVTPELEKLFESPDTETSENYKDSEGNGLEYYKEMDKLKNFVQKYNRSNSRGDTIVLSRFGTNLYVDGYVNASILRAVDISEGVEMVVNDLIDDNEVQRWTEQFAHFVKYLYSNFVEKTVIKAVINLEL